MINHGAIFGRPRGSRQKGAVPFASTITVTKWQASGLPYDLTARCGRLQSQRLEPWPRSTLGKTDWTRVARW
jgi:hypothetical protein